MAACSPPPLSWECRGRALSRERRLVVRDGVDVPRGRRPLGRIRHTRVTRRRPPRPRAEAASVATGGGDPMRGGRGEELGGADAGETQLEADLRVARAATRLPGLVATRGVTLEGCT